MATFIERCVQEEDFEGEGQGGAIDLNQLKAAINIFDNDELTSEDLVSIFNCTVSQTVELNEILATRPNQQKSELKRAQWAEKVVAIMYGGFADWPGFETASACRVKLGLSA
jgi:hypothetical protein